MSKRSIANNKIDLSGTSFTLPATDSVTFGTSTLSSLLVGKANTVSPSFTGNVGIGSTVPRAVLDIVSTGAIILPAGSASQQPSGIKGLIRYNTDTNIFEGYTGTWGQIGSVATNTVLITGVSFSLNSWIVTTNNTSGTLGVHVTLADDFSNTATKFITLHSVIYDTSNNTFKIFLTDYKNTPLTINTTYDNLKYNIILTKNAGIVHSGLYRFDITGYAEKLTTNPYNTTGGRLRMMIPDITYFGEVYTGDNFHSVTTGGYSLCRLFVEYAGPTIRVINSNDGVTYDIWFNESFEPLKAQYNNTYIYFGSTYTFVTWRNGATLSITTWYDQSPKAKHLTVPSGSTQPTLELDTGIGGYAVFFDSSDVLTAVNAFSGTSINQMTFYTSVREVTRTEGVVAISYNGNTTTFGAVISGNSGIKWTAGINSGTSLSVSSPSATSGVAINISGIYNSSTSIMLFRDDLTPVTATSIGSTPPTCGGGLRIGSGYIGYFKYLITTINSMTADYYHEESNRSSVEFVDYNLINSFL